MTQAKHTPGFAFSYDGFGINDASDPYRPRLLTFAKKAHDRETMARHDAIGKLIEAAPDLARELSRWQRFARENGWTDADYHDADGTGWISSMDAALAKAGA